MNQITSVLFFLVLLKAFISAYEEEVDDDVSTYLNMLMKLANNNPQFCIKQERRCDHRPDRCCPNLFCRCNLFGTNCLCQRKGIFQWG